MAIFTHKALLICLLAQSLRAQPLLQRPALLAEIDVKLERVQQLLARQHLAGVLLFRTNNFAWATAGLGDNHILLTNETGPAGLLLLGNGKRYVVGPKTETDHLLEEGLRELGYEALSFNWYDDGPARLRTLVTGVAGNQPVGADNPTEGFTLIDGAVAHLRYQLTDSELKKYRWVCRQASEAVAHVCRTIRPGMSERQIEALTLAELQQRGLQPTVVMIGVDDRLTKVYHYPPTDKKLRRMAFVNVCARRWGMVTSIGRYVYFGPLPASVAKAMRTSADVSARMQAHTRAGVKAADVFRLARQRYAELGYPDQWQRIHSGGAIGYAEREWVATDSSTETLLAQQAFAWNPFMPGALSFDTVWLRDDNTLENLTALPNWPTLVVTLDGRFVRMPAILVRPLPTN